MERLRRSGGVKSTELERLAKTLGRKRRKGGREPTWVSEALPEARPLSIPSHPSGVNRFTARTILDQLEADLEGRPRQALGSERLRLLAVARPLSQARGLDRHLESGYPLHDSLSTGWE